MKNVKAIFFDLDNTLVDFGDASNQSFIDLCQRNNIPYSIKTHNLYKKINSGFWNRFEQKKIGTEEIKKGRFQKFVDQIGMSHLNGLDLNHEFLEGVLKYTEILPGAKEMVEYCATWAELVITTNGLQEIQRRRVHKVGLTEYFKEVVVSDEIGMVKPHVEYFEYAQKFVSPRIKRTEILVVGDSLKSDIEGGHNFGALTAWIKLKAKDQDSNKARWTVNSTNQLMELIKKLREV